MKRIGKIFLAAIAATVAGLVVILVVLYFGNGGSDFTLVDLSGFATIFAVFFALVVICLYVPVFSWYRRKTISPLLFPLISGVLLNIPIYILLAVLIGRKVSPLEGVGFMFTFLVAGLVFGWGYVLAGGHKR